MKPQRCQDFWDNNTWPSSSVLHHSSAGLELVESRRNSAQHEKAIAEVKGSRPVSHFLHFSYCCGHSRRCKLSNVVGLKSAAPVFIGPSWESRRSRTQQNILIFFLPLMLPLSSWLAQRTESFLSLPGLPQWPCQPCQPILPTASSGEFNFWLCLTPHLFRTNLKSLPNGAKLLVVSTIRDLRATNKTTH